MDEEQIAPWLQDWRAGYQAGKDYVRAFLPVVAWCGLLAGIALGYWYAG
jgi:hypothetical protein